MRILTFAILILLACGWSGCSSVLYYPAQNQFYDPVKFNLEYENVYFEIGEDNERKTKLHGWWFNSRQQPAKGTFVFFHGNAENLSSHFLALAWLPEAGYNFLIFDYPGYGQSQGSPSPHENVRAGLAAVRWVHEHKDSSPLIIYGQSMGGIVALRVVNELTSRAPALPIKVVIADGTFSSFQRVGRQILSKAWVTWLLQPLAYVVLNDRWAPDVARISPLPLIVMHGTKDPVIDIAHGRRIFVDAHEPKQFIEVAEGRHGDLFFVEGKRYRGVLLAALEALP